jgi:hypothetical protein
MIIRRQDSSQLPYIDVVFMRDSRLYKKAKCHFLGPLLVSETDSTLRSVKLCNMQQKESKNINLLWRGADTVSSPWIDANAFLVQQMAYL